MRGGEGEKGDMDEEEKGRSCRRRGHEQGVGEGAEEKIGGGRKKTRGSKKLNKGGGGAEENIRGERRYEAGRRDET